jgi:hypothetical protein
MMNLASVADIQKDAAIFSPRHAAGRVDSIETVMRNSVLTSGSVRSWSVVPSARCMHR